MEDVKRLGITSITSKSGVAARSKAALIEFVLKWFNRPATSYDYVLILTCHTGETIRYKTFFDIPEHSVPCPCGDPTHWLIKYEESDANNNSSPAETDPTSPVA